MATIHDVARRARVSVATVSRALSTPQLVRESTRERIVKAAKALDYHPNRAARSLITGKTGNLGIVVPDLENPFYPSVVRGVQARAHQAGYALLLADSGEDPAAEQNLVHTMAKQVDGVIVCAPFSTNAQIAQLAQAVPLVLINRRLPDVRAVLMDAAHGMREVIDHLLALGHRRCAYLGGPRSAWSNHERSRGLRTAARAHRVELLEYGPFEPKFEGGIQAADLALAGNASAIVAFNDLMALGVLSRLAARGIRVPDDVSVVGCDDVLYAAMCAPPLTTVAMPTELAGRVAVDLLLASPTDAPGPPSAARHTRLQTQLIVRATTAAPPP
ncbi:MAG TPA: LacI family DNA-binding transcriptional regulator [Casimicrobiaceae bacterium]|nr:LacI family DNA-binding transcriptional regulator [Casimicrobiaceae bacterium]